MLEHRKARRQRSAVPRPSWMHSRKNAYGCVAAAMVAADQECINGGRLIALGCRAIFDEFCEMQTSENGLTSVENSSHFAHNWSQWGWSGALKDTWRRLNDAEELDRAGLKTSFTHAYLEPARACPAEVRSQDAIARRLGQLVFGLLQQRSGSMSKWTSQWPYQLAGLLAAPSQAGTMASFKLDTAAWWGAKDST